MAIDPNQLREVLGTFATGCTVVTMNNDPYHGLTANAFSSVSLDPPLVLICVDHDTTSYELLSSDAVDGFCVNILSKEQQDIAEHFANMTELAESPFETRTAEDIDTGAPVFAESLAYLDCSIHESIVAGDHTIYIGHVEDCAVVSDGSEPLAFYTGSWGTVQLDE